MVRGMGECREHWLLAEVTDGRWLWRCSCCGAVGKGRPGEVYRVSPTDPEVARIDAVLGEDE